MEAESTERNDWKWKAFRGLVETRSKGDTPAKTPNNSENRALTDQLLLSNC